MTCRSTESFCGDTSCPVHGQPEPQPVMLCPACLLDVPLSKAATESIAAELRVRGIPAVTEVERNVLRACRAALEAANYWDYYEGRDEFPRDQISNALEQLDALERASQSGDQIAPDTAEPAEKQPDSR